MSDDVIDSQRGFSKTVAVYTLISLFPILWLVVLSFQPHGVSASTANLIPSPFTLGNYAYIFSQENYVWGYINAIGYVIINIIITLSVSIPGAYAFSRFKFIGSENALFFALLFRLMPPAIILIPLVQLFSSFGLIDTYFAVAISHSLFTVPISIWILEGFISSIPKEMEETALVDGYSLFGCFVKIILPQVKTGIGVAAFFSFMFSWVELIIANGLTTVNAKPIGVVMRLVAEPLGFVQIGISSAASILMLIPGLILVWFLRNHLAKGFSMGRVG